MNQNGNRAPPGQQATSIAKAILAAVGGLVLAVTCASRSSASASDLCLTAARQASSETGVPLSVLVAITQVETGRQRDGQMQPWPWAINLEGAGTWFESREEAIRFARTALSEGRTSFDTGCFQINYRWHSDQFTSLEDMFDPLENARYAAKFLKDLRAEMGDWSLAAGAYHSRNEIYASGYRDQFDGLREKAVAAGADQVFVLAQGSGSFSGDVEEPARAPRENTYPLLGGQSGGHRLGSLVPVLGGG